VLLQNLSAVLEMPHANCTSAQLCSIDYDGINGPAQAKILFPHITTPLVSTSTLYLSLLTPTGSPLPVITYN
jgi:hypothetical protein